MPRGDGTGPMGMGPMTGRAAGFCAGYSVPGYMNAFAGRGAGFGGGFGRGHRNWFRATGLVGWQRAAMGMPAWGAPGAFAAGAFGPAMTQDQETESLTNQAKFLENSLGEIRKRLEELKKSKSD
ncbi:MAG: DUF5320 domain-containing protein [Candidatus Coatesbacteria bacterium]|nr:DUF5320 domain-containing protein [Candidatus Coatesbacteria bacterium]